MVSGGDINVVNGCLEVVMAGDRVRGSIQKCVDGSTPNQTMVCGEGGFDSAD